MSDLIFDETTISVLAAVLVFISIYFLGSALVPNDPMASRLRSHQKRRDQLRAGYVAGPVAKASNQKRAAAVGSVKRLLDRMKLLRGDEAKKSNDVLSQAGFRSRDALVIYTGLRVVMPFIGAFGGFFAALALMPSSSALTKLMIVLICAIVCGIAPGFALGRAVKMRQQQLRRQLPDGLDLLVICAEAGLSLDAAFTRVSRELGLSSPALADELGLTSVELGFLPNRRQALMNLTKRTGLPQIRGVVNTLVQTERYGTPLAHSLRVLSSEFRDERMMKAEEKAARLPAMLTVPMILFILPVLFMVMVGPAVIQLMAAFQ